MAKRSMPINVALYPLPVVLVSCRDESANRSNLITLAWCGVVCSAPPLISISIRPSRFSHKIISVSRQFAVNIPSSDILRQVDLCGNSSGSNTDKIKDCGFKLVPASRISAPLVESCPVNIECEVKSTLRLGTHDMFIGEVVAVQANDEVIDAHGKIDYSTARPFTYNQGEYWAVSSRLGVYGLSKK